jgi:DNA-binding response OmpR family regulator
MTSTSPRPTVLLVEDSDDDAFFFRRALQKCRIEHDLVHLPDGGAAIRYLEEFLGRACARETRPASHTHLFLDLKLPILSGFEVLEWLRNRSTGHGLHISILSGSDSAIDVSQARQLGVRDYFVKPVTAAALRARLLGESSGLPRVADASPA